MIRNLLRIIALLEEMLRLWEEQREEAKRAAARDPLLETTTTKFMLQVSERTLFNYVSQGKLICEKRGLANFYLESSVLELMKKSK